MTDNSTPTGNELPGQQHEEACTNASSSSSSLPSPTRHMPDSLTPDDTINELLASSRSLGDIRAARESRAAEALKLKDEQIRILNEQNSKLLESIDRAEEEIGVLQTERDRVREDSCSLRENNFQLQAKAKASDGELEKALSKTSDRDKHYEALKKQNAELLKLLDDEEANTSKLSAECEVIKSEAKVLREANAKLLTDSKSSRDTADASIREAKLQAEEIRLLKSEIEQLKKHSSETLMKNTVELESLHEQLRVRKEKQYQLLTKMQQEEEARIHADDLVSGLEEKILELKAQASNLETQLQLEAATNHSAEDANDKLQTEVQELASQNKSLLTKYDNAKQDRLRMESEARDNGEQLREMAEKVFQLLERLKLAELGKTRSMEALKSKENEVHGLKRKNASLVKEATKEATTREKAELDRKALDDQLRALKKQNAQLGVRCKEEARAKIREEEGRKDAEEKVETLNGRLSFILNRLQSDEEEKSARREETKKVVGQLKTMADRCEVLQEKLDDAKEHHKELTQQVDAKDSELKTAKIKHDALQQAIEEHESSSCDANTEDASLQDKRLSVKTSQDRFLAGGRLRFFIESKPTVGLVIIKAKNAKDREWLESKGCNVFLRKAIKSSNSQEILIQRMAEMYGAAITMEEEIDKRSSSVEELEDEIELLERKLHYVHNRLGAEEESKRRTLLKYINAIKASVSLGEPGSESVREEVGRIGKGRVQLPEANLGDEEAHAIAAMLRNNQTIEELNLRGNGITDDGARALAAILACRSALRFIDLRSNRISRSGIKAIAEALERSGRVNHVYVHAGGKIEALGGESDAIQNSNLHASNDRTEVGATVCIVDVRDNQDENSRYSSDNIDDGSPSKEQLPPQRTASCGENSKPSSVSSLSRIDSSPCSRSTPKKPSNRKTNSNGGRSRTKAKGNKKTYPARKSCDGPAYTSTEAGAGLPKRRSPFVKKVNVR